MRILIIFSILIIYSYAQCTGGVTSNLISNSDVVGSVTYLWDSSKLHVCFVIADNYCMESSIVSFGSDKDALVPHSGDYGCSSNINVEFDVNDSDSYLSISVRVRQYTSWLPLGGVIDIYTVTRPLDRPSGLTRPYWDSYVTVNGETRDFDGNCIDYYTGIDRYVEYPNVELFSFQDELAPVYPGSILKANWLANQDVKENFLYAFPSGYARDDVQKAIWALVHDKPSLADNANSQFFLAQANTNSSALSWTGPENPDDYDSIIAIVDGGEEQNTMFHVKLSESVVSILDSDEDNGNDLTISGSIYEDCENDCSKSESESTLFTGLTVKLYASDNTLLDSFLSSDGTFSFTVSRNTQYHIDFDPSGTITGCDKVTVDSGSYENIVLLAFDTSSDPDGDGYGENCDICPDGDDSIDNNNNGIPDACECLIECTKYGYIYDEEACTCEPICGDGLVADIEECEPTETGPDSPCCNSVCEFVNNSCEDGNLCIENDYCSEGVCIPGETVNCDKGNACFEYSCDPDTGCVETDISDSCNGDNACVEYSCDPEDGCVETDISDSCNGDNACFEYSCDPEDGCVETDISDSCNGDNVCVEYSCDPEDGCVETDISDSCNGDNACFEYSCDPEDGCVETDISDSCNGDNKCFEYSCDPEDGCVETDISDSCNGDNACVEYSCDPEDGCVETDISDSCNGDNACFEYSCDPEDGCVETDISDSCNGDNACFEYSCDPEDGCVETDISDSCNGDNICFEYSCDPVDGCIETDISDSCNGDNACFEYSCDPEDGCVETDISDSCNGDNACFEYSCDPEEGCVETDISDSCNGDNKCFEYSCDADIGCFETDISSTCNDNDDCTEEYCDPDLGCVYSGVDCDDSSVCTRDYCLSNGGCQYEDLSDQCNDFDVCTTDSCDPINGCSNEVTTTCEPRNACETAECDPIRGCVYFPIECPESSDLCKVPVCDENSGCGFEDLSCSDDGDLCTNEECNSDTGLCTSSEIICTDENTDDCILTYCDAGICVTGSEPDCNDNNPCTIDTCVDYNCVHTHIECNSGDPCNPEVCVAGVCVVTPIECPDSDADCGGSICDGGICVPKDDLTCDDGSLCTTDMCIEGECQYFENTCNDNNACTDDSCDPETGECINTPIDISCESDLCVERECDRETGNCVENSIVDCDTNHACGTGECNPDTGLCEVTEFDCDDGLFCTIDICEEDENGDAVCRHEQRVCPQNSDLCVANYCSEDSDSCESIDILCVSEIECIEGNCIDGNCVFTRIFGCGNSAVPDPSDPVAIEEPLTSSSSSSIGAAGVGLVNEGGGDSGASAVANEASVILANNYSTTVVAVGGVGLVLTFAFFAAVLGFNNSKQQPEVPLDALLEETEANMAAYDNPINISGPDAFLNVTST